MDKLDEVINGFEAIANMVINAIEDSDMSLETKAMASLARMKIAGDKFMDKMAKDENGELNKVYEEQFNTIITYSNILTNAINEILGEENE